jgi:hypothetical protein
MNGAEGKSRWNWRAATRAAALPLLAEIALRAFRVPLFPGFAPLLSTDLPALPRLAVYVPLLLVTEMFFLGGAAWELVAAVVAGSLMLRQRRLRLLVFACAAAAVWSLIGVFTGSFPIGALGLDTLLTAVLMRVADGEILAGLAARLVLSGLVLVSAALFGLLDRSLRRLLPAVLASAVFVTGCDPGDRDYFQPLPAAGADSVEIVFKPATFEHPVLAEATDEACLVCHGSQIATSDLPPARKGIHEIHYGEARIDRPCVFCHESAGRIGFPGEYPQQQARGRYNQKCAACHSDDAGPYWAGRWR